MMCGGRGGGKGCRHTGAVNCRGCCRSRLSRVGKMGGIVFFSYVEKEGRKYAVGAGACKGVRWA